MISSNNKSLKKRQQIIDAALATFLENGYDATSIDNIVKKAGGSKATVYNHFKDKTELFSIVIDEVVKHDEVIEALKINDKPEQALLKFALSRLKVVFNKKHVLLRRVIIGESSRFPELARMYYKSGPGESHTQLVKYFKAQGKQGRLIVDDPGLAADIFTGMLIHAYYLKSLYAMPLKSSEEHRKKYASVIVEKFIKIYRN